MTRLYSVVCVRGLKIRAHSYLKATIGSTFVVRRAGIKHVNSATSASNNGMPVKVNGSVTLTLNNMVFINCVNTNDAVASIATLASAKVIPLRTISQSASLT